MDKLFFVYGSLKWDGWNHHLLHGCDLVSEVVTKGEFLLTDVGFPYLVPKSAHTDAVGGPTLRVLGEMYRVCSEEVEALLDALEGVEHNHYKKEKIWVFDPETDKEWEVNAYIPYDEEEAAQYPVCNTTQIGDMTLYEF